MINNVCTKVGTTSKLLKIVTKLYQFGKLLFQLNLGFKIRVKKEENSIQMYKYIFLIHTSYKGIKIIIVVYVRLQLVKRHTLDIF